MGQQISAEASLLSFLHPSASPHHAAGPAHFYLVCPAITGLTSPKAKPASTFKADFDLFYQHVAILPGCGAIFPWVPLTFPNTICGPPSCSYAFLSILWAFLCDHFFIPFTSSFSSAEPLLGYHAYHTAFQIKNF